MPSGKVPHSVLGHLQQTRQEGRTQLALLLDPDQADVDDLPRLLEQIPLASIDLLFVGGSLMLEGRMKAYVQFLKTFTSVPVLLFPGHVQQVVPEADALLFLSLLSGRNPELLIGQHVHAAPLLFQQPIEVIPTAYLLIDGGHPTSVSYMSQSLPIPRDKPEIAFSTAYAGQLLGMQLVYLEAGSGAQESVPPKMVRFLKDRLSIPIIVGGGIRSAKQATALAKAGADLLVVGNAAEKDPGILTEMANALAAIPVSPNGQN